MDSEDDLDLIEKCFEESKTLSATEKSALFYISGYVARKECITRQSDIPCTLPESGFTTQLSRGGLSIPPYALYDLSMYLYTFFKMREDKCCTKIFFEVFHEIYSYAGCNFSNEASINRRFANCFFKSYVNNANDKLESAKDLEATKRRRLCDK